MSTFIQMCVFECLNLNFYPLVCLYVRIHMSLNLHECAYNCFYLYTSIFKRVIGLACICACVYKCANAGQRTCLWASAHTYRRANIHRLRALNKQVEETTFLQKQMQNSPKCHLYVEHVPQTATTDRPAILLQQDAMYTT